MAIFQGTDLENMPPNVQQTAVRVLPKEIVGQMRGATQAKAFEQGLMNILTQRAGKDKDAQQKMAQMNNVMKQMQETEANATFKADAAAEEPVASGTCVQMPGVFSLRYLPQGYMKTCPRLMVPNKTIKQAATPITFHQAQYLAVLGQAPAEQYEREQSDDGLKAQEVHHTS